MVARKTTKTPTRIWSFHAEPPRQSDLARAILWKAHHYYNKLIEIERERVREYRETREFYAPHLVELREAVDDALASTTSDKWKLVKDARTALIKASAVFEREHCADAREAYDARKSGAPASLIDQISATKERIREMKAERAGRLAQAKPAELAAMRSEYSARLKALELKLKELGARKRSYAPPPRIAEKRNAEVLAEMLEEDWPEAWKDLAKADADAHEQTLKARAECGLPPGCYLLVEMQAHAAIRDARPDTPRFRAAIPVYDRDGNAWPDHGRIGVQITGTVTCADLRDGTSKAAYWPTTKDGTPGAGKPDGFSVAVRGGSNPDRSPIMVESPARIHRELPPDAQVKWAWLKVCKHGQSLRWQLQLTLESDAFPQVQRATSGSVELHCEGVPVPGRGGIRVATWLGSDGDRGEIVVSPEMLKRLGNAAFLRSAADNRVNEAYRALRRAIASTGSHLTGWHRWHREGRRERLKAYCRAFAIHNLGFEFVNELWKLWKVDRRRAGLDLYSGLPEASRWLRSRGITEQSARIAWYCELWSRKDSHLRKMEADVRRSAIEARNQFFRGHGITLRQKYATLKADSLALTPSPILTDAQSSLRTLAAAGECRSIIRECFGLSRAAGSREQLGAAPKGTGARKRKLRGKPGSGGALDTVDPSATGDTESLSQTGS